MSNYKDILLLEGIKSHEKLENLLRALAYQIGAQASYNELSQLCGLSQKTVEKYVDVLEKAFIIFHVNIFYIFQPKSPTEKISIQDFVYILSGILSV